MLPMDSPSSIAPVAGAGPVRASVGVEINVTLSGSACGGRGAPAARERVSERHQAAEPGRRGQGAACRMPQVVNGFPVGAQLAVGAPEAVVIPAGQVAVAGAARG